MAYEKDENELGILWEKEGPRGAYFSGKLTIDGTDYHVVVFRNGNKKSEKAPDWRILRAKPRQAPASDETPF